MMLNLHIRLEYMEYCAFMILMSSIPAVWGTIGSLLLLSLVLGVLFVLKLREVATLKKQCEELQDTMRMMRYEEANLSRMLHTASKPLERPIVSAVVAEEGGLVENLELKEMEGISSVELERFAETEEEITIEETVASGDEVEPNMVAEETEVVASLEEMSVAGVAADETMQEAQIEERIGEALETSDEKQTGELSEEAYARHEEEASAPQLRKQAINERRPAIPVDLFSAWFAENEDASPEASVVVETERAGDTEMPDTSGFGALVIESQEATPRSVVGTVDGTIAEVSVEAEVVDPQEEEMAELPDAGVSAELSKEDERFCRKLERIVTTRLRNPNLNIDIIAAQFGIGRTNFYRKVRELTGFSPNDYLKKCRMERAAELLDGTEEPINEVCAQVGIPDAQYFSRVFKAHYGVSPSVYREKNNQ